MISGLNDALLMRRTMDLGFPVAKRKGQREYQDSSYRNSTEFRVQTGDGDGRAMAGWQPPWKREERPDEVASAVE